MTDAEQGTASPSAWSSITFTVLPRVSGRSGHHDVQLITVNAQGQRIAPTIVGKRMDRCRAGRMSTSRWMARVTLPISR